MADAYTQIVKNDFEAYNYHVHNVGCEVGKERWKPTRFHKKLCKEVQEFVEKKTDNAISVMLIMCPPQHGKSCTVTETLPAWYLGHHPEGKVIVGCYNTEYSRKFGLSNRRLIENHGYLFNEKLSKESKSIEKFQLDNGYGSFLCAGLLAGITGNGGDLIIIDDPIKNAAEASSKTTRDKIWQEYLQTVRTRTSADAKVIVIMTPWHEDDLAGRIQKTEEHLTVLKFPCECEDEEHDPLGRKKGDALCPEIGKNNAWLKDFKESFIRGDEVVDGSTGRRAWQAMFQCSPVSEKGNLVKRDWWKFYDELPKLDRVLMSVDCAFKAADSNDYVAIQVWGKKDAFYYLIDSINAHLDFPQTVQAIIGVKSRYRRINEVLIEDKANGSAVIAVLQGKISGIIPITPNGGKEARVNAVSYVIEAGNVFLPRAAGFTYDFIEQFSSFPNGTNDDMVDACTQALGRMIFLRSTRREQKQIDHYKYLTYKKPKKHGKGKIIVV